MGVEFIRDLPDWLVAIILVASSITEYVFPPFPGDVVLIAGGFYAARGAISLPLVFISLTVGSLSGALIAYWFGHLAIGSVKIRRLFARFLTTQTMDRLSALYLRYGFLVILFNRALPGVRGPLMVAAGLAKLPLRQVIVWGGLSALIWNTLLIGLGFVFSYSLETLIGWFKTYSTIMLSLIFAVVAGAVLYWVWKRKK